MNKQRALELLGGTVGKAAAKLGITPSAVSQWPEELTEAIENRVIAAIARERWPELAATPSANDGA